MINEERDYDNRDAIAHLQLLDAITDGDQLAGSPQKTVLLDALHVLEHLVHVSLIVPRLRMIM